MIHVDRDRKPTAEPAPPWARTEIPLEHLDEDDGARGRRRRRFTLWRTR